MRIDQTVSEAKVTCKRKVSVYRKQTERKENEKDEVCISHCSGGAGAQRAWGQVKPVGRGREPRLVQA